MKNKKYSIPFESFLNYTTEMYDGNSPTRKEDFSGYEVWTTKYGDGKTSKGEIVHFKFNINQKVTVYIIGSTLTIVDDRYSGKFDEWIYCNKPENEIIHGCSKNNMHQLEPERIEKYLSTDIPNCKIWEMVKKRAKELMK